MKNLIFGCLVLAAPTQVVAEEELGTLVAQKPQEQYLPAGTEVVLRMNSAITTRNKSTRVGDKFFLTVVYDITKDGKVIIPQGTAAVGEVTWRTGKAVFGKSGKMDVEMRYLNIDGKRLALNGKFRQEGEGNTTAVVGATVLTLAVGAGIFITGKSATIPSGREFIVSTAEPMRLENSNVEQVPNTAPAVQNVAIEKAKSTCSELGFVSGTEKHANCVLQLVK